MKFIFKKGGFEAVSLPMFEHGDPAGQKPALVQTQAVFKAAPVLLNNFGAPLSQLCGGRVFMLYLSRYGAAVQI